MGKRKCIWGILVLFVLLWAMPITAQTAEEYAFGENLVSWNGTTFVGSRDKVYCIEPGVTPWNVMLDYATGRDFFASGNELFFIADSGSETFLCFYDMLEKAPYVVIPTTESAELVGRNENKLYYLDLDDGRQSYEGKTLRSYDLSTGNVTALAEGIGRAMYWNGIIIMSGAASDASTVEIMMLDANEQIGLVDENCVANFWAGQEGFYYFRCNMTDDISWDGVTLCTIDTNGRRDISGYAGNYIYPSVIGIPAGNSYFYFAVNEGGVIAGKGASVETGQVADVNFPESMGIPVLYRDGDAGYWYMNKNLYYWSGAGYENVLSVGSSLDDVFLGVADGMGYYDKAGEGDTLMQVPLR